MGGPNPPFQGLFWNLGGITAGGRPLRNVICQAPRYIVTNNKYVCPANYERITSKSACQAAQDYLALGAMRGNQLFLEEHTGKGDPQGCWVLGETFHHYLPSSMLEPWWHSTIAYHRLYWNLGGVTTGKQPSRNVICQARYIVTNNKYLCPVGYEPIPSRS